MHLDELQDSVDAWIRAHGDYRGKFEILARLTEELGDVACTLQHEAGYRSEKAEVKLSDEVGDLLFTLAVFANVNGLRLADCLNVAFEKYRTRDSQEW